MAETLTAVLFGLQHLSAFALTSRGGGDILMNVLLSGIYGFALAAYQFRFRWIWPLILVHALADFTTVLAAEPLPDLLVGISHVLLLAFGIILLRGLHDSSSARSSPAPATVSGWNLAPRPLGASANAGRVARAACAGARGLLSCPSGCPTRREATRPTGALRGVCSPHSSSVSRLRGACSRPTRSASLWTTQVDRRKEWAHGTSQRGGRPERK